MTKNSFGETFRLTTFGESHAAAIGGIIDGCPAGLSFDYKLVRNEMARRRPGQSVLSSARNETDEVEWLSGVFEGKTLGTPIAFLVRNRDARPADYEALRNVFRPSHADFTYQAKYHHRDHRGGGRASGRETAARVAGGAVAKMLLAQYGISVVAYVSQVGNVKLNNGLCRITREAIEQTPVRCPHKETAALMQAEIAHAQKKKDSVGGIVSCVVAGVQPGLGEPVFDKLTARLAAAMMSIGASRGFEIGEGFAAAAMRGSEHNDHFVLRNGRVATETNHSGGVQGGISNGEPVVFRVAFKPVATIGQTQRTLTQQLDETHIATAGRHDPCVVPRTVPVVEAMAALTLADFLLLDATSFLA